MRNTWNARAVMAWIVLAHLVFTVAHGTIHAQTSIPLSPAENAFVIAVILAGPLIGLGVAWIAVKPGSWIVAGTMLASLVFGVVKHFVLISPDHFSHVDERWRTLFIITSVMLAVTEALGAGVAAWAAVRK
jgi:hypothetical protein